MRVWAAVVPLAASLAACADDEPATPAPTPAAAENALAYETLAEVAEAADCGKLQDIGTGGNPGLKAFGVCYVGSANVDIYLTSQRNLWEHLADQFPAVLGPNWVILSPSGGEGARVIHERLGGELKIPPSAAPS